MGKASKDSNVIMEKMAIDPQFDLMYFMSVNNTNQIEQDLLEQLETYWKEWKPLLHAYHFYRKDEEDKGYVLIFFNEDVEDAVEAVWQNSPSSGMSAHNLAISMVMLSVQGLVPEVMAGACAPLPKPDKDIRKKFKKLGLEWRENGTVNRSYAVFTPYPFSGGCEICYLKDDCPKSACRPQPDCNTFCGVKLP